MATTVFTDGTNFTGAVGKYYDKKMIEQLIPKTVLYDMADKRTIPLNQGATAHFYKISEFTTGMATVTEGTTPSAEELSVGYIEVTLKQKFAFHQVSDIVDMTAVNPVVDSAIEPISNRAAKTVDKEILWRLTGQVVGKSLEGVDPWNSSETVVALSDVFNNGAQGGLSSLVFCADGRNIGALYSNNAFGAIYSLLSGVSVANGIIALAHLGPSTKAIRSVVAKLWRNNAQPADGQLFEGVCAPEVLADLMGEDDFIRWSQFTDSDKGKKNYLGEFAGVKWNVSQTMHAIAGNTKQLSVATLSATAFSAYATLIFGKGCYGVTELTGKGGVKIIVKTPGPSDTSNPGDLYSTVGAKVTMAATVLEKKRGYFLLTTRTA
jgi:N4-gp56 family major capsid protein